MKDREDWIIEKCQELADIQYGKDFFDLTEDTRMRLCNEAEEDFINNEADRASAMFDIEWERQHIDEEQGSNTSNKS